MRAHSEFLERPPRQTRSREPSVWKNSDDGVMPASPLAEEGGIVFHKASLQAVASEHLPVAHALRRPLPGVARLEDAGDAKPVWITLLTTEHCSASGGSRSRRCSASRTASR